MFTAAIAIYFILALFLGAMWPIEMFSRAGLLGMLIVVGWVSLLVAGL